MPRMGILLLGFEPRSPDSKSCMIDHYTTGVQVLRGVWYWVRYTQSHMFWTLWRKSGCVSGSVHHRRGIIRLNTWFFANYSVYFDRNTTPNVVMSTSYTMYVIISIYQFRSACDCKWKNNHTHLRKYINNAEIVQEFFWVPGWITRMAKRTWMNLREASIHFNFTSWHNISLYHHHNNRFGLLRTIFMGQRFIFIVYAHIYTSPWATNKPQKM